MSAGILCEERLMPVTDNRIAGKVLPYLALAVCTVLVYGRIATFEFVWDDDFFVVRNHAIRSWASIPRYFTDVTTYAEPGTWAPMYRPLRNISYLLDYKIAGLGAAWFHVHNLLLHVLNACLALALLKRLASLLDRDWAGTPSLVCLLASALWTVHPVQTESVAWVKSRDELLFATFYLGAVLVYCQQLSRKRLQATGLIAICLLFSLAILSKEMAATFPLIALLIYLYAGSKIKAPGLRTAGITAACTALLLMAFMVARHLVIGQTEQGGLLAANGYQQFLTMLRATGRYVQLTLVPGGFLADYQAYPRSQSFLEPKVILSTAVIIGSILTAIAVRRPLPLISFGIAWFWVTLLPVLNIIPSMQFLAERFLYLPLFGFAVAAAGSLARILQHILLHSAGPGEAVRKRKIAVGLFAAMLFAHLAANIARLPVWQNSFTLYSQTFEDSPACGRIWLNYASELMKRKRYAEAHSILKQLNESNNPMLADGTASKKAQGYGLVLMVLGHEDEGASYTLRALDLNPDNPEALANMGLYYGRKGVHEEALRYYQSAVRLRPEDPVLHSNIGHSLASLGRYDKAINSYRAAMAFGAERGAAETRIRELETILKHPGQKPPE